MLASVFAIDAVTSGRHTHESIADLFDGVGRDNPNYANSVLKELANAIRGGSLRPSLTLIEGGKSEE